MSATSGTGTDTAAPTVFSCHAIERMIGEIWSEFFECEVRPDDDFYELGGDSVAIIETVFAARQRGLPLRSSEALRNPTPARLAEYLTVGAGGTPAPPAASAVFQAPHADGMAPVEHASETLVEGDGAPLYLVHSDSHRRLEQEAARQWGAAGPVRALRVPVDPQGTATVADLAGALVRALRSEQPAGPYRLAGFGAGAVVAFEMGRRLYAEGGRVDFVALVGPAAIDPASVRKTVAELLDERASMLARRFALTGEESPAAVLAAMREAGWYDDAVCADELADLQLSWARLASAVAAYEPSSPDFPTVLIQDVMHAEAMDRGWNRALGDVKALWLDHGTVSPRAVVQDPRSSAFMKEVLAA